MVDLPAEFLRIPLAHRALHDVKDGRPENSRAAIQAAISAGYGIEIDIQRGLDNRAMVFHDDDLARLAHADGPVTLKDAAALGKTMLRGGDEGIPTLTEVLAVVAGRVPLLIEIKDQDGEMGANVGPLEQDIAQALQEYKGPVAVMSFNPHSVGAMASLMPHVARGLVTCSYSLAGWRLPSETRARLRQIPDYETMGCSFISHDWRDLSRARVAELKEQGAHILCWTVKSPTEEAQAREIADNITFEQYMAPFPA